MGSRLPRREAAIAAGVPVVPGTGQPLDEHASDQEISKIADGIGFPLVVKAVAGGGGKGMRTVDDRSLLASSITTARSEARSAFGDGAVYLEREIHPARHIEVQLLGDVKGTIVAIGERDCSLQRRHQKLVEEAPSTAVSPELRQRLAPRRRPRSRVA
jgi:acetyl/propionyl-CoA carboxylase alpha subunit